MSKDRTEGLPLINLKNSDHYYQKTLLADKNGDLDPQDTPKSVGPTSNPAPEDQPLWKIKLLSAIANANDKTPRHAVLSVKNEGLAEVERIEKDISALQCDPTQPGTLVYANEELVSILKSQVMYYEHAWGELVQLFKDTHSDLELEWKHSDRLDQKIIDLEEMHPRTFKEQREVYDEHIDRLESDVKELKRNEK